jgi:7-carboxy-7-deazaguanine synthase
MFKVNEVTETIHGEMPYPGLPCLLVRFSGCDIKCPYCDTDHDKFGEWTEEKVLKVITETKLQSILITGGEPFLQEGLEQLLYKTPKSKKIVLETNGNIEIKNDTLLSFGNVTIVMDVKLFDNLKYFTPMNLTKLTTGDVIKFVFWSPESFKLAEEFVYNNNTIVPWGVKWVFSPTADLIKKGAAKGYSDNIIELQRQLNHQEIYFQTQLHKIFGVK